MEKSRHRAPRFALEYGMRKRKPPELKNIGVCIKGQDGTIEYQNKACADLCGVRVGKKCVKGCMHHYSQGKAAPPFEQGFHLFRNIEAENKIVDAVMINDGEKLTTLLYDKSAVIEKQLALLEPFGLSKAEVSVIERYLKGFSNLEIAAQLFISKATLRTHLNNIYKKLPDELKKEILASHLGKEIKAKPSTK